LKVRKSSHWKDGTKTRVIPNYPELLALLIDGHGRASKANGVAKGVAKNVVWRDKEKRVTPC
jgi:hypothetical protein